MDSNFEKAYIVSAFVYQNFVDKCSSERLDETVNPNVTSSSSSSSSSSPENTSSNVQNINLAQTGDTSNFPSVISSRSIDSPPPPPPPPPPPTPLPPHQGFFFNMPQGLKGQYSFYLNLLPYFRPSCGSHFLLYFLST